MSETETEQQEAPAEPSEPTEAPETPAEPETGEETEEDAEPIEGPGDEPTEPATEEGAPTGQVFDEKEMEKQLDKIARENDRHTKRIEEIMAEGATDLLQCPLCSHFVAGWIYPPSLAPLPEEAVDSSLAVLGFLKPRTLKHASDTDTCPECEGEGDVETGSRRQGYESKACGRCGQTGYIVIGQPVVGNGNVEQAPTVTGPTVYGQEISPDPEVQHLRDRGFIVVPPVNAAQPA